MPNQTINSSTAGCPTQKPPPPLELALKTEKSDAPIVGIGRQQEDTMSSLATWGVTSTSTCNSDVKEDNDGLLATFGTATQSNRKRPAVDPKVDKGASNLTGIINLCDDNNKEEEKEEIDNPINIDDTIAFPSLSSPSPPSPSPTERPKKELILKELHRNSTVGAVQLLA
jgi:hypothetical protein